MRIRSLEVAAIAAFLFSVSEISWAASFKEEVRLVKANKSIVCLSGQTQKADSYFGAQWNCNKPGMSNQLYISEEKGKPGVLKRIVVKIEENQFKGTLQGSKDWLKSVIKHYAPAEHALVTTALYECEGKVVKGQKYNFATECYSGSSAKTYQVTIVPKPAPKNK